MDSIDIGMLTCNRKRITELCIRELASRTTSPYRLIVADNGSMDGTVEVLKSLFAEGLIDHLFTLRENFGVHAGFNFLLGVVQSKPYYICTDADIIPPVPLDDYDWLQRLINLMDVNPDYGAITCRPHIFIGGIPNWDESKEVIPVPWAGAALRIMRTEVVRKTGGWANVKRPSRNGEERWISDRLKEQGFKVGYSRDIQVIHEFGRPELGEDPWGYPDSMTPADHGHREIHPPVHYSNWDRQGIDWETCLPK